MSDTLEPIDAILAEMRDKRIIRLGDADVTRCMLLNLADRIEAAAEREEDRRRDEVLSLQRTIVKMQDAIARQADAVNAAALRVALENARSKFIHIKKCANEGEVSRKKLTILCEFVSQEIAAALATPARNCDRYTTAKDALDAFIREKEIKAEDVDGMNLRDFFDWLFAKAEGKDNSNG